MSSLQSDVVVLGAAADEVLLVEAGGEAGLLRRGEDERLVVALDHRVGHALEVPRPLAHAV